MLLTGLLFIKQYGFQSHAIMLPRKELLLDLKKTCYTLNLLHIDQNFCKYCLIQNGAIQTHVGSEITFRNGGCLKGLWKKVLPKARN